MTYNYMLYNFEYCRNKRSDYSYAEQQCEIRCRIFIRNLIMQLLSGQIKRHPEISTGVHKPLHLKLHQFQSQIGGNPNDDIDTVPSKSRKRKRCVRCYASKMSRSSKYFGRCCENYLCLEHSDIVCDNWYRCFTKPNIEDSD